MKDFWKQSPHKVAVALLGKSLVVRNTEAVVLVAGGYSRHENVARPLYRPLIEAEPGTIYCPRLRNTLLFLVATLDHGERGGCVLVQAVEVDRTIYRGPGRVTASLGLSQHGLTGEIDWQDEDTLLCQFAISSLRAERQPKSDIPKLGNGIGKATLARLMPQIVAKFLRSRPRGMGFREFLNSLLADNRTEVDLWRQLK